MLTKVQWAKRAFLTVFLGTIAIVAVIGLLFGKVIEATLWEEIAKWAIMAVVLGVIMCVVFYAPIMIAMNRRSMFYEEYGKKWWIHDLKLSFNAIGEKIKGLFKRSK